MRKSAPSRKLSIRPIREKLWLQVPCTFNMNRLPIKRVALDCTSGVLRLDNCQVQHSVQGAHQWHKWDVIFTAAAFFHYHCFIPYMIHFQLKYKFCSSIFYSSQYIKKLHNNKLPTVQNRLLSHSLSQWKYFCYLFPHELLHFFVPNNFFEILVVGQFLFLGMFP